METNIDRTILPDAEVIRKILAGEQLLFELLMRRNNSAIYKIGRAYGFNHQDTEDLMQEAHITAYTNLSKFEGRSKYKTWLIKIMINACLGKMAKASYRKEQPAAQPANENTRPMFNTNDTNDTEKQVLNRELANLLESSIEQIAPEYRTVFILREKEGLSVAETAEAMDISVANVKVRLNRAKAQLRQKLETYYTKTPVYEFNLIYCDKMVENVFRKIGLL